MFRSPDNDEYLTRWRADFTDRINTMHADHAQRHAESCAFTAETQRRWEADRPCPLRPLTEDDAADYARQDAEDREERERAYSHTEEEG